MNKKYLYGKKKFLKPLITGECGLRFSDISHYARLENEIMRDDEIRKQFTIDRYTNRLEINGHVLNPNGMVENPIFSIPIRHCYCLCLSNRKDSAELFEKFQADICIEIDVEILLEALEFVFSNKLKGMEVKGKNVDYYDPFQAPPTQMADELVFYKPEYFYHEAEYRIALFYPNNKPGFLSEDGAIIPFHKEDESMHMFISHEDPRFITQFIVGFTERGELDA